jgi:hypothetical protein
MPRTPHAVLALVAAGVVGLSSQGRSVPPGQARLTHIVRSTVKVEQLIGDYDKERKAATRSQTQARFGVEGTDLGSSFEHAGRAYFLFGDTLGPYSHVLDTIATTDARDPEAGVRLDFMTGPPPAGRLGRGRGRGRAPAGADTYLTIEPAGLRMEAFEVPAAGISLAGQMYVVVSTNHTRDRWTDRSVLTRFRPPSTFEPLRTISSLPDGHFVKMSLRLQPSPIDGLPPGGPFVLVFGTGRYRSSDAYLSIVPAASFERGEGTRYFAGLNPSGAPIWRDQESDAVPIVRNGTMGDLSVTWSQDPGLWLMTYDSRPPARRGIEFSYAATPWGPWSAPELILDPLRDRVRGTFIHVPGANPPDGLAGPVIGPGRANPEAQPGGAYAPYVVERWTRRRDSELTIYYVLSTWNPYVVVLMKSAFQISGG